MRVMLDVTAVPAKPVGAGVYVIELARQLGPELDLHLAARRNDATRWPDISPKATAHAVAPSLRPVRLVWEQTRAANLARTAAVDVWHGPHYTLPLNITVPAVVTIHDMTLIEQPEWHERMKVKYFSRMIYRSKAKASALIAVSEYTADRVREMLQPEMPVFAIPHGIDHAHFTAGRVGDPDDLAALAALGITGRYIAFTGTHEPRKNLPGLIDAFARIAGAHPDVTLVLGGPDGWGSKQVAAALQAAGLGDRIMRTGRLPYAVLPAFYRQAEFVCYPSLIEGFGLPALEALASGSALISTSGSAVETFADDAALLTRPGDTADLADAMDALLRDDATRARLRARGPVVAAPYTWERSAALHLDAYAAAKEYAG